MSLDPTLVRLSGESCGKQQSTNRLLLIPKRFAQQVPLNPTLQLFCKLGHSTLFCQSEGFLNRLYRIGIASHLGVAGDERVEHARVWQAVILTHGFG